MPDVPHPTPIYHITCVDNVSGIIGGSGLRAYADLQRQGVVYTNIAHQHIQDRRARKAVRCGPGGMLHDYVPFYFAPRSPRLYAIYRGNVAGYDQGQASIVHLVSTVQLVQQAGAAFVFTDGHAPMDLSEQFDDLAFLDRIDWPLMGARYWNDILDDPDRSRRRQAEFLVRSFFPWKLVTEVGVINSRMKGQVEALLRGAAHQPPANVRPGWYY